jgi:glycosyltransferase involved in cell wall biosynthesis
LTKAYINNTHPDLIHAHNVAGAGWIGTFSGFHPILITSHGSDLLLIDEKSLFYRILTTWVLKNMDHFTCISEILKYKAVSLGVNPNKIEVAQLGINKQIYKQPTQKNELKKILGFYNIPIIANLRPIQALYNPLAVASAINLLSAKGVIAQYIVFKYNSDQNMLNLFHNTLSSSSQAIVTYIEPLDNDELIAQYYQISDIAISVPRSEGAILPLSVQESMACGSVVIISELSTHKRWLSDKKYLYVIPDNEPTTICNAVMDLIKNDKKRESIKANAQSTIEHLADWDTCMKRYEEIYESLIQAA